MELNLFNWLAAATPIILLIVLLAVFKVNTAAAAFVTLIAAVMTSAVVFEAGAGLMVLESVKGLWNGATILYIIFPALMLYETIEEAGCISAINSGMKRMSPDELFRILAVGLVFAGFLQGITGFGVPVAICVPVLMSFGVKPDQAVVISLLGQSWGNTFGTLGVAWDMLADIGGLVGDAYHETAFITAMFLWMIDMAAGLAICWIYGRWQGIKKGFVFVAVITIIQGGGEVLFSQVDTTIAAFIPSTLALLAVPLVARLRIYRACGGQSSDTPPYHGADAGRADEWNAVAGTEGKGCGRTKTLAAFSPYMVLIATTVVLLVIEPVNDFLGQVSIGFPFPETVTGAGYVNQAVQSYSPFYPLVDSGTVLLATCLISYLILRKTGALQRGAAVTIVKQAFAKTRPSAISICLLLMISKLMSGTGQTIMIAGGVTAAMGEQYALLAGFIGLIGSFITGSNMSSNILFTDVQVSAAAGLGTGSHVLLAAQTSGAAAGSMISPSKIVLGAAAAGQAGREGEILRILLPVAMGITLIIGIICRIII